MEESNNHKQGGTLKNRALALLLTAAAIGLAACGAQTLASEQSPDTNQVGYWCDAGGIKLEPVSTPFVVPSPPAGTSWVLLVLKAGSGPGENEVFDNPVVGQAYERTDGKDISHAILCSEPNSTTLPPPPDDDGGSTTTTTVPETATTTTVPETTTTTTCPDCGINTVVIIPSSTTTTTLPPGTPGTLAVTTTTVPGQTTTTVAGSIPPVTNPATVTTTATVPRVAVTAPPPPPPPPPSGLPETL